MEIQINSSSQIGGTRSPSSSASPSSSTTSDPNSSSYNRQNNNPNNPNQMQSWWESISKARTRIHILSSITSSSTSTSSSSFISSLADSDRPARSLLESSESYLTISNLLSNPNSGSGNDSLCQWLYETYQSSDPDLRLVVLSFIPLLSGFYLSRIISLASSSHNNQSSLSGFEAVLLSIYAAETKARAGEPCLISIPDLSQPSLYDSTPRNNKSNGTVNRGVNDGGVSSVGVLCAPLEPQVAVKSTKRACIVSVALDCYYKQISQMPSWSKLELCQFSADWAGKDCSCRHEFDNDLNEVAILNDNGNISFGENRNSFERDSEDGENKEVNETVEEINKLRIRDEFSHEDGVSRGVRIPLPWELLQIVLRILGHCLLAPLNSQEVRDSASSAIRCLYARAVHDIVPQAILATRSLIRLDKRSRLAAKEAAMANAASNANTPSKAKKPEILLMSK